MFRNSTSHLSGNQFASNPVLKLLHKSTATFVFCGSRRFGGAGRNSDWDFWAQNSNELREWLIRQGFEDLSDEHYEDPGETVAVLRHQAHKVDVSLQKDLDLTIEVMHNILLYLPDIYPQFTKEQRKHVLIALKATYRAYWRKQ